MFSGIIEALGRVVSNPGSQLTIGASTSLDGVRIGDSVAVNGCCVTVAALTTDGFTADVMPETYRRTTLGSLRAGEAVNLERALAVGDRIGGHFLAGHVDAVGTVLGVRDEGNARRVSIEAPADVLHLTAPQGSIAIDGISLTVVDVSEGSFSVSLIPHTMEVTNAGQWAQGSRVNVEADLIARYVRRAFENTALTAPLRGGDVSEPRRTVVGPRVAARSSDEPPGFLVGRFDRDPERSGAVSATAYEPRARGGAR